MDSYCTAHTTFSLPCHSERSGTDIKKQVIKPKNAAESNPEGAPAGGISALVYGIIAEHLLPTNRVRQPHTATNSYLPKHKKTSPESTRPIQSESNLHSAWAGALGGSSGWVREVWRVGRPLRKGSPYASKVFLTSLRESFNQRAELGAVGMAVKIKTA